MDAETRARSRRRSRIATLGLALLAARAATAGAQGEPQIVKRTDAGYSVDAYETNVVEVLSQVGQHAGFTVQAPDNFSSSITLDVEDAPLDQVLHRVLRNENYIIVYRGGVQKKAISGEAIDKIFLLSPASGQPAKPITAAAGVSPLAGPGAQAPAAQRGQQPPPESATLVGSNADLAARAAEARARAEARRAALGQSMPPAPPGPAPNTARMVEQPGDFTPPPPEDTGEITDPDLPPMGDVPPADVPPESASEGDDGAYAEDY